MPVAAVTGELQTPSLRRRMASFLYEGVILFGVGLVPGVFGTLVHRALGESASSAVIGQAVGFLVFGAYFVWLWTKNGQTLPMQTWKIRVVTIDGAPLSWQRSVLRYLASWVWVAPAACVALLAGWSKWQALAAIGAWMILYALSTLLQPRRQFWHDALCGTQLITWPAPPKSN